VKAKLARLVPVLITGSVMALVCALQWATIRYGSHPAITNQSKETDTLFRFDFVNLVEWMTYDWRMKLAVKYADATTVVAPNLGYVECTDKTVATLLDGTLGEDYRWGLFWPRHLYGRVVEELAAEGAKVVAFDVLFGELRPDQTILVSSNRYTTSDRVFAQAVKRASNVVLAAIPGTVPPELFRTNALALGDIVGDQERDAVLRREAAFRLYRLWDPLIERWARTQGMILETARTEGGRLKIAPSRDSQRKELKVVEVGADGTVDLTSFYQELEEEIPADAVLRSVPFRDQRVWSMGIVMAAREIDLDLDRARIELDQGRIVLPGRNGHDRVLPVDEHGYFYIDWSLQENDSRLTKADFEGLLALGLLRRAGMAPEGRGVWWGKLAVIGSTASGRNLADLGGTPVSHRSHLMSKHWNVANSVIVNRFIRRSAPGEELLLIILLGGLSGWVTWRLKGLWASVCVLMLVCGYTYLACVAFIQFRYWLPLVLPVAGALLTTHVCTVTYRAIVEQNERRRVKGIFSKIVSPDVVNELLGQDHLALGQGMRRPLTVFFADVRGFTQMTDDNQKKAEEYVRAKGLHGAAAEAHYDTSARETLATVNLFLATIADNVKKHNGTLDKYIGDCVMAFWGAPTPNEQHALACVRAAIDSQRAMHELNVQREAENRRREAENPARLAAGQAPYPMLPQVSLGTGINTGMAIVGLMGSEAHILNYTVFGREVNLASRLEGVSGRGRIIISETTLAELKQHDPQLAATCVALDPVTVKGITQPVSIYEVPWRQLDQPSPT